MSGRCKSACSNTSIRESVRISSCERELQEPESFVVLVVTHLLQDAGMLVVPPTQPTLNVRLTTLRKPAPKRFVCPFRSVLSLGVPPQVALGSPLQLPLSITTLLPDGWM